MPTSYSQINLPSSFILHNKAVKQFDRLTLVTIEVKSEISLTKAKSSITEKSQKRRSKKEEHKRAEVSPRTSLRRLKTHT